MPKSRDGSDDMCGRSARVPQALNPIALAETEDNGNSTVCKECRPGRLLRRNNNFAFHTGGRRAAGEVLREREKRLHVRPQDRAWLIFAITRVRHARPFIKDAA